MTEETAPDRTADQPQEPEDEQAPEARTDEPAPGDMPGPAEDASEQPAPEDEMQSEIDELTSDLKRLQAEYVNYKRRVDRDRELVVANAKLAVLTALLPLLDDIDRARDHGELEGGFKAIADNLERIVSSEGLERYGEPGDPFDPQIHEALMHSLSSEVTTTTCDKVVQAGYRIGARVVRPAMVVVVDPDPAAEEKSSEG